MGITVAGTFNATAAYLYFGIGFRPDWVRVQNLQDASGDYRYMVNWNVHMRRGGLTTNMPFYGYRINTVEVGLDSSDGVTYGIVPFAGLATPLSAASTSYLVECKYKNLVRQIGSAGADVTWTLGNSTNKTGNFSSSPDTTYFTSGETGSIVIIEGNDGQIYTAVVTALTTYGTTANTVTLDTAVPSGKVLSISPQYDWQGAPSGSVIPAGFRLGYGMTGINDVAGELHMFEAGTYDNTGFAYGTKAA